MFAKQKKNKNKIIRCVQYTLSFMELFGTEWERDYCSFPWNNEILSAHTEGHNISGSLSMMMMMLLMINAMIAIKISFILFIVTDYVKMASDIHKTIIT